MKKAIWSIRHCVSSVVMILALLWLTVSLPYVYAAQQRLAKQKISLVKETDGVQSDNSNPFANTTEEKAPGSITPTEEFLHQQEEPVNFSTDKIDHSHYLRYDVYVAFHGELLSPPPESFLL